ncbi:MAG: hypothetical protein ACXWXV_08945 [Aeromicrobium sp.]
MATLVEEQQRAKRDWHELLVTVLLAVAAVATAWSSYQAARWHGEQAVETSRTNAVRIEAARADNLADTQNGIDVATFIAWTDADRTGEQELADYYQSRFRPEFRTAFDAWMATDPFTNPEAAQTPFAMPEYKVAAEKDAERLDRASEKSAAVVRLDIQRASNYVLTVVLYAVTLFFAGTSNQIRNPRLRTVMIVSGYILMGTSIAWVATFPVSIEI